VTAVETVTGRYLGFRLEITEARVDIYGPTGRWVGCCRSISTARRMIRGYRGAKR